MTETTVQALQVTLATSDRVATSESALFVVDQFTAPYGPLSADSALALVEALESGKLSTAGALAGRAGLSLAFSRASERPVYEVPVDPASMDACEGCS